MKTSLIQVAARGLILLLLPGGLLLEASGSNGSARRPVSESVTVTGRVFDGRFLESESSGEARGVEATLKVFECRLASGGRAPGVPRGLVPVPSGIPPRSRLLAKTRTVRTGDFLLSVVPSSPQAALYVEASRAGFLPVGRIVPLQEGRGEVNLYLAPTLITGTLIGPDGKPAITDIWVLREEQPGRFVPYEFTGARTLRLPFGAHRTRFRTDTDAAGDFSIPVRHADARFRLLIAVDTNTDKLDTLTTDPVFVKTHQLLTLNNIQLRAPRPSSPEPGPAPATSL